MTVSYENGIYNHIRTILTNSAIKTMIVPRRILAPIVTPINHRRVKAAFVLFLVLSNENK